MDYMNKTENVSGKLRIVHGDSVFGVHGDDFHYLFSYQHGGMESLVIEGKEWLYRVPKPTYWRALTDNDRGSKFHLRSGMWMSADLFQNCVGVSVKVDGEAAAVPPAPDNNCYGKEIPAKQAEITFTYETITTPSTKTEVTYLVNEDGKITVSLHYYGKDGLPELPVLGLRFIMPTKAAGYCYEGLSGETYPDRMAGAQEGVYTVEGLPVTRYLVPQDCGVHMNTKWAAVTRSTTLNNADHENRAFALKFTCQEEGFAFSALPYTAQELENATHQEELPAPRRTVVSILGAVRGVGGIDSWGADVEKAYHIDAQQDIQFSFTIEKGEPMLQS